MSRQKTDTQSNRTKICEFIKKCAHIWAVAWILLFVFQNPLSGFCSVFSYIDEAPLFLLAIWEITHIKYIRKENVARYNRYIILLGMFAIAGLAGNVIYRYQPVNVVIIDVITNFKFWGAVLYFYLCICNSNFQDQCISKAAKALTVMLMLLFVIDRVLNIFPAQDSVRYRLGIKSAQLFYEHPTYLAAICAFLIALMTLYDPGKHRIYIFMNLIMLVFTLRSKALVSAAIYVVLYIFLKKLHHQKLKLWHIALAVAMAVICACPQIYFYFIENKGSSPRSIILLTSLHILKDYFPIGTGFACYASHCASAYVCYSPVYVKYGFQTVSELSNSTNWVFFDDQFWPIIFGQTGVIGTIGYVALLILLFQKIQRLAEVDTNIYMGGLFAFIFLLVSSAAEPAFNNAVAIPFAFVLALAFSKYELLDT